MPRKETNRIIVHHSQSRDVSASVIDEWHRARGFDSIGYHYVIHPSGVWEHGRPQNAVGAHAKGRNADSVGVCLTGDFSQGEPTLEQLAALGGIYHALCRYYGKRLLIEFHHGSCPGVMLDREDLLEVVYRECPV